MSETKHKRFDSGFVFVWAYVFSLLSLALLLSLSLSLSLSPPAVFLDEPYGGEREPVTVHLTVADLVLACLMESVRREVAGHDGVAMSLTEHAVAVVVECPKELAAAAVLLVAALRRSARVSECMGVVEGGAVNCGHSNTGP